MGDLNAKVGQDSSDCERVMGKHEVGTRNDKRAEISRVLRHEQHGDGKDPLT